MSAVVQARVVEHLRRLRLGFSAERLDALLADAARREPTYLDFLDGVLREEVHERVGSLTPMPPTLPARDAAPELSVVMPAYNESGFIDQTLKILVSAFRDRGLVFEMVVVENGTPGLSGDNGPATGAQLNRPVSIG